jgi:hypothetical protein
VPDAVHDVVELAGDWRPGPYERGADVTRKRDSFVAHWIAGSSLAARASKLPSVGSDRLVSLMAQAPPCWFVAEGEAPRNVSRW